MEASFFSINGLRMHILDGTLCFGCIIYGLDG